MQSTSNRTPQTSNTCWRSARNPCWSASMWITPALVVGVDRRDTWLVPRRCPMFCGTSTLWPSARIVEVRRGSARPTRSDPAVPAPSAAPGQVRVVGLPRTLGLRSRACRASQPVITGESGAAAGPPPRVTHHRGHDADAPPEWRRRAPAHTHSRDAAAAPPPACGRAMPSPRAEAAGAILFVRCFWRWLTRPEL